MGIDARMFVRYKGELMEENVLGTAYRLAEAFDSDTFLIDREGKYDKPRHCLEIINEYQQDGDSIFPKVGEQFIEVYLFNRYYGVGYERGDLPLFISIAKWLEINIPGCEVWYGGDSSGVLAVLFDGRERSRLFEHFCRVGHLPYRKPGIVGMGIKKNCNFCKKVMIKCGWVRAHHWVKIYCPGCGQVLESNDDGQTWEKSKEDS